MCEIRFDPATKFRMADHPKPQDRTYITNCPLCNNKVEATVKDVPYYMGIIEFPIVCDHCKAIWQLIKKKYTEGENDGCKQ